MRKLGIGLGVAMAGLVLAPTFLTAQTSGRYGITVLAGQSTFADGSALKSTPVAGLEAQFLPTEMFGIGFYIMGARPTTDERYFPMTRMEFNDSVYHYLVSQQVVNLDVGVSGSARAAFGQVEVMGLAGVGRYYFSLDNERIWSPREIPNEDYDSFGGLEYLVGGSIGYHFGESGAIRLQVRDVIYTDFDRNRFDVSEPLLGARNVPHPHQELLDSENKDTIHNIRFNVGFTFFPGGR